MQTAVWSIVLLSSVVGVARGQVLYEVDDVPTNFRNNAGPSFNNVTLVWGNYFTVQPGGETINEILVAFGSIDAGLPVQLLLFDDPDDDNDPANANLVASTLGLTANPDSNTFNSYALPPTQVEGGFFVAARMTDIDGLGENGNAPERPMRGNTAAASGASWFYFGPDGEFPADDLEAAAFGANLAPTSGFGSWMVRAVGVPEPTLLTPVAMLGLLLRRRS